MNSPDKKDNEKNIEMVELNKTEMVNVNGAQKLFHILERRELSGVFPMVRPVGIGRNNGVADCNCENCVCHCNCGQHCTNCDSLCDCDG